MLCTSATLPAPALPHARWVIRPGCAQMLEKLAAHHAMARVAQPEEVAAPIVFLASDSASFITGANLPVDGGALLGHWCALLSSCFCVGMSIMHSQHDVRLIQQWC